jgi:tagatose 1,6-diphosphate aldolase
MATTQIGATRLLGLDLTPGKLRGLQRISNADGTLTMVATDQNSSMIGMIKDSLKKKGESREPSYEEIVEAKVTLARALAPHCSGLLVDGYYGYWNTVASFAIPPGTGVLVRVEKSGGEKNKHGAPLAAVEPGWGVDKIKRCGADAVKVLTPFEPGERDSAEHQLAFLKQIQAECAQHDILLLLEPVAFPHDGEKKDDPKYIARKAETVIESARILSRHCDVYKAEFPGDIKRDSESTLANNLKALDAACERPWVLLSAGVDFPDYKKQVELAVKHGGASGVLGGRAFWKEYFQQDTPEARQRYAEGECVERVKTIDKIVKTQGKPWFVRYGLTMEQLHGVRAAEGWHFRYGGGSGAAAGGPRYVEGEVY